MKTSVAGMLSILVLIFAFVVSGYSQSDNPPLQYTDDALRYSMPGTSLGARPLGLGMTTTGTAEDFSAMYSNPAGLGQIKKNEFSLGLSYVSYGNTSNFFNTSQSLSSSATNINDLGLVYAVPTARGSFVIALGYGKYSDFTSALSFSGFNPNSSIIPSLFNADTVLDLAYNLNLQRSDGSTPFVDRLTQSGTVLESGGINHWSFGGAIEATRNLYLGVTLSFLSGSYNYTRNYSETDKNNIYDAYPFDLTQFRYTSTVSDDISGFNARLGLLYNVNERLKVGLAIRTPSFITIREKFTDAGISTFDSPGPPPDYLSSYAYRLPDGAIEYDLTTPFMFSAGVSYGVDRLTLMADAEYTDWTQMEFRNADPDLLSLNTNIKERFTQTLNLKLGAEYTLPPSDIQLRGGFAYLPSPYSNSSSSFAQKYATAGVGFMIENAVMLDFGYAYGFWKNAHLNYQAYDNLNRPLSATEEDIHTHNIIATVSYRF